MTDANKRWASIGFSGFLVLCGSGMTLIKDFAPAYAGFSWLPVAFLICVAGGKTWYETRPERYNRHVIETSLRVFLEVVGLGKLAAVRCMLWVPKGGQKDVLEPACRYIPGEKASTMKELRASVGIVGQAYRTEAPHFVLLPEDEFPETEDIHKWLIQDCGFDKETVRDHLRDDRRAYCAIPIIDVDDRVLGVIYCDSKSLLDADEVARAMEIAKKIAPIFVHVLKVKE